MTMPLAIETRAGLLWLEIGSAATGGRYQRRVDDAPNGDGVGRVYDYDEVMQMTTWHEGVPDEYRNQIVTGDARELAKRLPDESVDLIFADPVYERIEDYAWLAREAARVLKPSGSLLAWQAVKYIPETTQALSAALMYRWTLNMTRSNVALLSCYPDFFAHWTPCFWYTRNKDARPRVRFRDSIDDPFVANLQLYHKWHKPSKTILSWLNSFTHPGDVVFDPFTGGGTVPSACRMTGRSFIAFEIDPDTAARARARVEATQAIHPAFLVEQEALPL